ncbi:MAG: alpha-amylase family glycosyl hydrolase [Planctomycetaceae bacterium]
MSEQNRGTFAGVVDRIPYLQELGVTVQLIPFQFDPQDGNHGATCRSVSSRRIMKHSCQPLDRQQHCEFRGMVQALHAAGIEVILDVVYNHTCEGDHAGRSTATEGIDNSTYYLLTGDPARFVPELCRTGNTLHTANRAVRQLILDSLWYWVTEMHVDGFRLALVFTRSESGSVSPDDPPIFGQISAEPELADIRLIAEPWTPRVPARPRFPATALDAGKAHSSRHTAAICSRRYRTGRRSEDSAMYGSSDLFPTIC